MSASRLLLMLAIGAVLVPGCTTRMQTGAPPTDAVVPLDDVVITLDRGPCYGTCPVYGLTVLGTGLVRYAGRAHVGTTGADSATISVGDVERLLVEFERVGYDTLPARYSYGEPTCSTYVSDAPSAVTSLRRAGAFWRVEHDYGCAAVPRALTALERLIDQVAGSERWTKPVEGKR